MWAGLKVLSEGWSGGLVGMGGFFWLAALVDFTQAINADSCDEMDVAGVSGGSAPRTQHNIALVFAVRSHLNLLPAPVAPRAGRRPHFHVLRPAGGEERLNDARAKHGPDRE